MQCCVESLGQYFRGFLPVQCCPKSIKTTLNRIFLVQCCLEPFGEYCTRFLPMQYFPKSIKTILSKMFSCNVVRRFLENIAQAFYLCNVVPRELRQQWTEFFLVQYCLEPQGQYCLGYFPLRCCSKSIKTRLNMIFSYAMLSGNSWATLHKVFICAMLALG